MCNWPTGRETLDAGAGVPLGNNYHTEFFAVSQPGMFVWVKWRGDAVVKLVLKSADEWLTDPTFAGVQVIDPDGWDRRPGRFEASWAEKLTKAEMFTRLVLSVCRWPVNREREVILNVETDSWPKIEFSSISLAHNALLTAYNMGLTERDMCLFGRELRFREDDNRRRVMIGLGLL